MSRPAIGKGANTTEGANQGPQQSDAGSPAIVNWSVSAQIAPRPSVRVSGRPGVRRDLQADELALPVPVEQQQDVALAGALLQCLSRLLRRLDRLLGRRLPQSGGEYVTAVSQE